MAFVVGIPRRADRSHDVVLGQPLGVANRQILNSLVRVMHQAVEDLTLSGAVPDGHLQGVDGQVRAQGVGQLPAHDHPAEDVDEEGGVQPADVGLHVGEVGHPQPIGGGRCEVPVHQVVRAVLALVRPGGDLVGLAPAYTGEPQVTHKSFDCAAGDPGAFPVELGPDLVGSVDVEVLAVNPEDLGLQLLVPQRSGRWGPRLRHPVRVRGDLAAVLGEHTADRLDPEAVPVSVDEGDYLFCWRSSSAPKKVAADLRISLARRSSLFSRSRSFIRVRSSVVSPGRRHSSVSARRTQSRNVSWLIESFSATDPIAAHQDEYSSWWSRTMRIARSLISVG